MKTSTSRQHLASVSVAVILLSGVANELQDVPCRAQSGIQGASRLHLASGFVDDQEPPRQRKLPGLSSHSRLANKGTLESDWDGVNDDRNTGGHRILHAAGDFDDSIEEARKFVSHVVQDLCEGSGVCSAKKAPTPTIMGYLDHKLLTDRKIGADTGKDQHYCSWDRARVAGELYDNLDRSSMLQLLKRCETIVGRPKGTTDQWFLAKLLQRFVPLKSLVVLAKRLRIKISEFDVNCRKPFNIYDIIMARHFTRLPETTGSEKLIIWSISQVVSWLLETNLRRCGFEPIMARVMNKNNYYWTAVDSDSIELTTCLFKLWGPERFRTVTCLARALMPVKALHMSDACFLACFIRGVGGAVPWRRSSFCQHIGFSYTGRRDIRETVDEGSDFFGYLPINWDRRASNPATESHPRPLTISHSPAVSTPAVSTPAVSAPAVSTPAVSTPAVSTEAVSTEAVSTPAVSTPALSTPAVSTPAVSTPAVSTPAVSTPAVSTPAASTPAASTEAVSTPAVSTPAVSTPAVSTPAVSTPAVSTPAVSTPAVSTPAVSTPNSHRVTAPHPAITLSDISHEEASRSAMQYAAVLRDWALRKAAPEEVEKAPCTSEVALDLRKRSRVEEGGCSEGKRGKFHDTCVAD